MRIRRPILAIALAVILTGCGSVGTTVDGHSISGKCLVYATLCSNGHEATVDLDGKTVQVTSNQITWSGGGLLRLPATWNHLELADSGGALAVDVDGRRFASVQPAQ